MKVISPSQLKQITTDYFSQLIWHSVQRQYIIKPNYFLNTYITFLLKPVLFVYFEHRNEQTLFWKLKYRMNAKTITFYLLWTQKWTNFVLKIERDRSGRQGYPLVQNVCKNQYFLFNLNTEMNKLCFENWNTEWMQKPILFIYFEYRNEQTMFWK